KAAFAMKKEGEISEPVLSQYGYHIIRYQGRKPAGTKSFAEVKPEIVADLRAKYIEQQHFAYIQSIYDDPKLDIHQDAVDALAIRISPEDYNKVKEVSQSRVGGAK